MLKKYFLLVVALFASVIVMRAQTISADCTSACENCPVVLKVDGFAASVTAIDWMKTTDGNTWTIVRTTSGNSGTFVDDMPNTAVSYKAKAQNGTEVSNIVTISLSTNSAAIKALPNIDCSKIKSYTAHLYKQEACVAVPGYTVAELPMLSAPTLEDLNGVDGNITGTYMGRRENCTSEPPKEPTLFSKSISLNADFKIGTSYILWAFADPSNNISYCLQKIKVIDDKLPSLNCPANVDLGEIPANDGSCSLSLNSLLEKMQQDQKPTATDNCSATSSITPMVFYRKVGDVTWIKITDFDAYIFNVGVQYELDWRFYKKTASSTVDNTVYVDCPQIFKVVDKEAPNFDCESLQDIHVMPNNYRLWHNENAGYWSVEYEDFASGNGTSSEDSYEFTLKKYFNDKTLQMHGDVSDNCNGNVKVTVEIEDVDGERSVITSLSAFQKHEFQIGTSTIYYTFSDDAEPANSKTCKQTIVVENYEAPVPDGGYSQKVVLNANDMGVATYPIDLSQVPTATIRYDKEVRYINDNTPNCNATYPDFDRLEIRKAMTGEREVKGYPHAVKLVKSDGSSELCENIYTNADTVQNKLVQHRKYAPERICKWDVISTLKLKRTNFASMPTCATTPLQVGTNKLIWYFENADGLESSYTIVIEVKDVTAPYVVCGD